VYLSTLFFNIRAGAIALMCEASGLIPVIFDVQKLDIANLYMLSYYLNLFIKHTDL